MENEKNKHSMQVPPAEECVSLFEASALEAHRHKWIESEKAGYDLGDDAIAEWYKIFWRGMCRECYVEHLSGEKYWIELDSNDYGLLHHQFHENMELVSWIIEIFKKGGENLDVVTYAVSHNYDVTEVLNLLEILDINARRIAPAVEITEKQFVEGIRANHHPRALIVDDDPATVELLKSIIQIESLECHGAASGEEALEEVQKRRYDLFIIDLMLPGKHGAEIAWYLRRHGVAAPIIAISAALESWSEDDLYDCGFTILMNKPFDIEALRTIAKEVYDSIISDN